MADIICLASSKGGSGKTTISATLGTFLSASGKKVLLVDCDEGTHGLTLMFLDEVNSHRKNSDFMPEGTFDVWNSATVPVLSNSIAHIEKQLFLLPARYQFKDSEPVETTPDFQSHLQLIVNSFRDDFDFIILDAQAGISEASKAAMSPSISDAVLLVSEYDPMSNAGIERLKARLPAELDVGRTWVLLNKLLPEFVSRFSEFLSVARYLPPIPWTADVVRAYSRRRLALDFENGNQFTLAILAILRELLEPADRRDLDKWVDEQAQRLREPIEEQLEDAEKILAQMEELADQEGQEERNTPAVLLRLFSSGFSVIAAAIGVSFAFADFLDISAAFDAIFSNPAVVASIGAAGTVALAAFFLEGVKKSVREDRERSRLNLERRLDRVSVQKKRVEELRALQSAGFEDIVAERSRQE